MGPRGTTPTKRRWQPPASLFLHEEGEFAVRFGVRQQLVAGLAREGLEILHRARVGGEDLEHLARAQVGQRLLRAQDWKRAIQSARVEFLVEVHGRFGSTRSIR